MNDDAVTMPAHHALDRSEAPRLARCKLEAGRDKMPAHTLLKIMPTLESFAILSRNLRSAPPLVLNAAQAFMPEDRGAQVLLARSLRRWRGTLDRGVNTTVDRFEREIRPIEIEHGSGPDT